MSPKPLEMIPVQTGTAPPRPTPWDRLLRFARVRPTTERCALCGAGLTAEHAHLLELDHRRLVCACAACSILFDRDNGSHYRRVPSRVHLLADFDMPDPSWDDLHIPINLAFFFHSSNTGRIAAFYPGPAGATESLLEFSSWETLVVTNPALAELKPDIEALLVNRIGERRDHYLVSIDECFKLVGLIRMHWRGLSGGQDAWKRIEHFFEDLQARSQSMTRAGVTAHA